eukprot:361326-Chlamydomonas_euryale.AAC.6
MGFLPRQNFACDSEKLAGHTPACKCVCVRVYVFKSEYKKPQHVGCVARSSARRGGMGYCCATLSSVRAVAGSGSSAG